LQNLQQQRKFNFKPAFGTKYHSLLYIIAALKVKIRNHTVNQLCVSVRCCL